MTNHAKILHLHSPSSNYLVHLDPVVFSHLTKLQHLDLSHNFLMSLPQPFFQVTKVTNLLILHCICFPGNHHFTFPAVGLPTGERYTVDYF